MPKIVFITFWLLVLFTKVEAGAHHFKGFLTKHDAEATFIVKKSEQGRLTISNKTDKTSVDMPILQGNILAEALLSTQYIKITRYNHLSTKNKQSMRWLDATITFSQNQSSSMGEKNYQVLHKEGMKDDILHAQQSFHWWKLFAVSTVLSGAILAGLIKTNIIHISYKNPLLYCLSALGGFASWGATHIYFYLLPKIKYHQLSHEQPCINPTDEARKTDWKAMQYLYGDSSHLYYVDKHEAAKWPQKPRKGK